jgi:hypothetical protein
MRSAESIAQKTLYRLWKSIPIEIALLWDGVVGDVIGQPSYNIHFIYFQRTIRPPSQQGSSFHVG